MVIDPPSLSIQSAVGRNSSAFSNQEERKKWRRRRHSVSIIFSERVVISVSFFFFRGIGKIIGISRNPLLSLLHERCRIELSCMHALHHRMYVGTDDTSALHLYIYLYSKDSHWEFAFTLHASYRCECRNIYAMQRNQDLKRYISQKMVGKNMSRLNNRNASISSPNRTKTNVFDATYSSSYISYEKDWSSSVL